eukprot:COSAG05_NODE_19532_length_291_cov_0.796875_1_plen_29_part_10
MVVQLGAAGAVPLRVVLKLAHATLPAIPH